MTTEIQIRHKNLIRLLGKFEKVAIAFSGGVDSTFLLAVAQQALGENIVAYTVNAPYIPDWEINEATDWVRQNGIKYEIIRTDMPENIINNPSIRCYLCKKRIFSILKSEAEQHGIQYLLDGTNKDDEGEYRPGIQALEELGVLSPLREVGLTKNDIRQLSKELQLPTWNKPAYACLLTRIPYNTAITNEELTRIEKGEMYLFQMGFKGARLRSHGHIARIEFQYEHFSVLNDDVLRGQIANKIKSVGYQFVCIDIEGYRMGNYDRIQRMTENRKNHNPK